MRFPLFFYYLFKIIIFAVLPEAVPVPEVLPLALPLALPTPLILHHLAVHIHGAAVFLILEEAAFQVLSF
jgi:hypothetical protein